MQTQKQVVAAMWFLMNENRLTGRLAFKQAGQQVLNPVVGIR